MIFVARSLRGFAIRYVLVLSTLLTVAFVEKFSAITRFALEYGMRLFDFLNLTVISIPTTMDFMLPISTIVAFYLTILDIRERREFIALASAGAGPGMITTMAIVVAVAATAVGLSVIGYLKPASNYAFRRLYEGQVATVVTKEQGRGRFFPVAGRVIQVLPGSGDAKLRLRSFGFAGPHLSAVYLADCAGMGIDGVSLSLVDCSARTYTFLPPAHGASVSMATSLPTECDDCRGERGKLRILTTRVRQTNQTIEAADLLSVEARRRTEERSLDELLRFDGDGFASIEAARLGVKATLIAFTNLLAVVCALVAVAFSTLHTRVVAPAAGIVALLGGMVALGSGGMLPDAIFVPKIVTGVLVAAFLAFLVLILAAVRLLHDRLIMPRMKRA